MDHCIVIVTFNRIKKLKKCIACILRQDRHYDKIIIVDNCSTDGTSEFLDEFQENPVFYIEHMEENEGGAGGFKRGVQLAERLGAKWCTLIDDDAMLRPDFLKQIDGAIEKDRGDYLAYAGVPLTKGIRIGHRRRIKGRLICREQAVPLEEYRKPEFTCDIASFCGLVIDVSLAQRIGCPEGRYFIWYDDTEYCLRIRRYTKIKNINQAFIDHRAAEGEEDMASWKDYYGIRNRIDMARRHYGELTAHYISIKKRVRCMKEVFTLQRQGRRDDGRYVKALYKRAIRDGWKGALGICPDYMPGKKRNEVWRG